MIRTVRISLGIALMGIVSFAGQAFAAPPGAGSGVVHPEEDFSDGATSVCRNEKNQSIRYFGEGTGGKITAKLDLGDAFKPVLQCSLDTKTFGGDQKVSFVTCVTFGLAASDEPENLTGPRVTKVVSPSDTPPFTSTLVATLDQCVTAPATVMIAP
jgi:hypothetical protein